MPSIPLGVRLVVFDWAGTTIDFGCQAPTGAFVSAFAERGVAVSLAEARGPMGLHKKDHIRELLRAPAVAGRWRERAGRDWSEADVDDLYGLVTPMQVAAAGRHSGLVPGVLGCVSVLRDRGVKVGATTGYFRAAADVCSAAGREQGYVPDAAVCADDVSAGRPAPWMLFRVMELLGVYPPAAVVKVGDTPVDMADGRNAGVWTVGVVDSSNEMGLTEAEFAALPAADREARRAAVRDTFLAAGAHAVIDDLSALPAWLAGADRLLAAGLRPG